MTSRPWPTPAPGEPDLIIRDPVRFDRLTARAAKGSARAARLIDRHYIAVAANLHIGAALQRYRATTKEDHS